MQATATTELFDDELAQKLAFSRRELLAEYRQPHAHPWIIGYSGGKDSTLVVLANFTPGNDLPSTVTICPMTPIMYLVVEIGRTSEEPCAEFLRVT